jgi:hypothetical protein
MNPTMAPHIKYLVITTHGSTDPQVLNSTNKARYVVVSQDIARGVNSPMMTPYLATKLRYKEGKMKTTSI